MNRMKSYVGSLAAGLLMMGAAAHAQPPAITQSLVMRFDATNIDGSNNSTLTNGQTVTSWMDLSGNNRHMTEVVGTPTFVSGLTQTSTGFFQNKPAVRFDFSDGQVDILTGTGDNVLTGYPVTIFVVSTMEDQSNGDDGMQGVSAAFSIGNSGVGGEYMLVGPQDADQNTVNTPVRGAAMRAANWNPPAIGQRNLNDGDLHVTTAQFVNPNLLQLRTDGFQRGTEATQIDFMNATNMWRVGAVASSNQYDGEFSGRIAEILVYSGNVEGEDLRKIEEYLITKWRGNTPYGLASLNFTAQTENYTFPTTASATLTNEGLTTLTVTNLTVNKGSYASDGLVLGNVNFPIVVPPNGGSASFPVGWTPADTIGDRDFTIQVTSNNPRPLTINVIARVLADVTNGLVLYYDFEETSGNVVVNKAPGGSAANNGDVIGASLAQQTVQSFNGFGHAYRASEPGAAPPFNNQNYIAIDGNLNGIRDNSLPADLHFGKRDFAVAVWVFLEREHEGSTGQAIFGSFDWNRSAEAGGMRDGIGLYRNEHGHMLPSIYVNSTGFGVGEYRWYLGDGSGNNVGKWTHWVITGGQGDGRVYINGEQADNTLTAVSGDIGNPNTPFVLGNNAVPGGNIGGVAEVRFDDFAVWGRKLDAAEVRQIYEQGRDQGVTLLNILPKPSVGITNNVPANGYALNQGSTFTLTVTIANNGQAPLEIEPGMTIGGPDAALFTFAPGFDTEAPYTVYPGLPLNVPLIFNPEGNIGDFTATLTVNHNTALTGTQTVHTMNVTVFEIPNRVQDDVWTLY